MIKSRPGIYRLRIAWAGMAVLLSGCGSTNNFTYSEYAKIMGRAFTSTFSRSTVPRETAAGTPHGSMGFRINGGDQGMLVLATDTNGTQLWTASSRIVFQTNGGRITRSVGLPVDLAGLSPQRDMTLTPPAAALQGPFSSARMADYASPPAYGVAVSCRAVAHGQEQITILGQAITTMRVDESCENRKLGWQFVDNYWLDAQTGFVWRSMQHLAPKGETVETEIFRPPG